MEKNIIKHLALNCFTVQLDELISNDYNPNRMPDVEMNLLSQSILKYGFLFPIITTFDKEVNKYRIIDGYHRYEVLKRIGSDKATIIDLDIPYHDSVQLTILMNRIKGIHQVEKMSDIISKLEDLGLQDDEICKNLGIEEEEYMKLKQQIGIAHAFKDHEYTKSWQEV